MGSLHSKATSVSHGVPHKKVNVLHRHSGFEHHGRRSSLLDEQNRERMHGMGKNKLIVEKMSPEDAAKAGSINYIMIIPVFMICVLLTAGLMKCAIVFY